VLEDHPALAHREVAQGVALAAVAEVVVLEEAGVLEEVEVVAAGVVAPVEVEAPVVGVLEVEAGEVPVVEAWEVVVAAGPLPLPR
jgi:hypothetical protein